MKNSLSRLFRSPLLWGGLFSTAFYAAVHYGPLHHPQILRYFAGHEVEYITTVMFFIGFAAMLLKHLNVRKQRQVLKHTPVFEPRTGHKFDASYAANLVQYVKQYEKKYGASILSQRLAAAVQFVKRSSSATDLDSELRYLADEDSAKADADYGLVRLILWAVPMLGFLGTVVGITMALGNLDLNAISESSKMMSAGLMVAFDTTALAIALDVALFFVQFLVYREENDLLYDIEKAADNELRGRFEIAPASEDNTQVAAVRTMLETVVKTLEDFAGRQAMLWERSMLAAQQHFNSVAEQKADTLVKSLSLALNDGLGHHAKILAQTESQILDKSGEMTIKFTDALRANAAGMLSLKEESVKQLETIQDVLGTSSQLIRLEERLNGNLAALAQTGNFEETVNALAAAIHLLNGKHRYAA
jgi:biopolymer transport protein ExbB/TolQ